MVERDVPVRSILFSVKLAPTRSAERTHVTDNIGLRGEDCDSSY